MPAVCYLRALPATLPDGPTLAAQEQAARAACAAASIEVARTVVETAAGPAAPEFRRMLRTILEASAPLEVVVGAIEALGDTARVQARRALQLVALDIPLHVAGAASVDAALAASWERRSSRELRREQVREGMRDVALRGEVLGRPPYGYRVVARRLRVDPAEADVVRQIFHRYLDLGEGVRVIARRLNEAAITTRRGGAWSMVSVREVLRNPAYVGTYRRLGVVVPSDHERLVTPERFTEVQRLLEARRTSFERQPRAAYLLAGLAVCGVCGNTLVGTRRRSRARTEAGAEPEVLTSYQCQSRTNQGRCSLRARRAEALESEVRAALAAAPDLAVPLPPPDTTPEPSAHRETLRRELDAMIERRMRGQWTADQFRQLAAPVALEDLQAEEAEAFAARGGQMAALTAIDLAAAWDALPFEDRRRQLRALVTRVVVTDDDVRVEFAR
ncbi:MAG: recombinase family protein [Dehalococcoidia bacterium]